MTDQMRSGQGGYRLRTHGGRVPIPWLIGTDGWALYIHRPEGTFELTGERGFFILKPTKRLSLDIFLVSSLDPATVIGEFSRLTGLPEMPPLWSLGYLQSHRTLRGPDEIKWVAKTFREKKLPCDALIYLGTDFTPSGWNTHNGEFTWHPTNFPNPKENDFWKNEQVVGGRVVSAIIPFGPVKQYTEERVDTPFTLRVYPGADGQFELYEDDGRTFNFRHGDWLGILMRWNDKSRRLSLSLSKGSKFSGQRIFKVVVAGDKEKRSISFSGRPVTLQL